MFFTNDLSWTPVRAGVWELIYRGPFANGFPIQWLKIRQPVAGLPPAPITFTLDGYSASPPFYFRQRATATAWKRSPSGTWPAAMWLNFWLSPWAEFWL